MESRIYQNRDVHLEGCDEKLNQFVTRFILTLAKLIQKVSQKPYDGFKNSYIERTEKGKFHLEKEPCDPMRSII